MNEKYAAAHLFVIICQSNNSQRIPFSFRPLEKPLGDSDDVAGLEEQGLVAALGDFPEIDSGDGSAAVDRDLFGVGQLGETAGLGDGGNEVEPTRQREGQGTGAADLAEKRYRFAHIGALVDDDAIAGAEANATGSSLDRSHTVCGSGSGGADELDSVGIGDLGGAAGGGHGGGEVEVSRNRHGDLAGIVDSADHRDELGGVVDYGEGEFGIDQIILGVKIADLGRRSRDAQATDLDGADQGKRCLTGFEDAHLDREIRFLINGKADGIVGSEDV